MSTATATAPAITTEQAEHDRKVDRGFFKAVGIGAAVGIVAFAALTFGMLRLVDSGQEPGAALGVAVWVGIWAGLFLGGTITVGLWSRQLHGD